MSEVGLDLDGEAVGKGADVDELVTAGSVEKDELRAARGFVAANFLQAEDIEVEADGFFEVVHAVAGVQQLFDSAHRRDNNSRACQHNTFVRQGGENPWMNGVWGRASKGRPAHSDFGFSFLSLCFLRARVW